MVGENYVQEAERAYEVVVTCPPKRSPVIMLVYGLEGGSRKQLMTATSYRYM